MALFCPCFICLLFLLEAMEVNLKTAKKVKVK